MMTYDDRGRGGLGNVDVINKGSFLEQYTKKITQYPLFLCLEYSAFQIPIGLGILFKKSTILPMLWRKKYMLNKGGVSKRGGVKNCQNGGDVICGWPLI